jgi:hypothetical protein
MRAKKPTVLEEIITGVPSKEMGHELLCLVVLSIC